MQLHAATELTSCAAAARLPPRSNSPLLCFSPKNRPSRRSPRPGHLGSIPPAVSTTIPSSTSPKPRLTLSSPEQSSPRARRPPSMAARGTLLVQQQPPFGSPKIEPPLHPLSSHALSFENGGRNHPRRSSSELRPPPMAEQRKHDLLSWCLAALFLPPSPKLR